LLDRLRQWPEYERTRDERSSKIDRWKGFKEFAVAIKYLRKRGYDIMAIIVGEGDPDSRSELEAFIDWGIRSFYREK
jgi:glycosyltransferase involved in cell wall biosynthesis